MEYRFQDRSYADNPKTGGQSGPSPDAPLDWQEKKGERGEMQAQKRYKKVCRRIHSSRSSEIALGGPVGMMTLVEVKLKRREEKKKKKKGRHWLEEGRLTCVADTYFIRWGRAVCCGIRAPEQAVPFGCEDTKREGKGDRKDQQSLTKTACRREKKCCYNASSS